MRIWTVITCIYTTNMSLLLYHHIKNQTHLGIWYLDESLSELQNYLNLRDKDLEILSNIKSLKKKKEWLGCRTILSEILQNKSIHVDYDEQGKPLLNLFNISFSHTNNYSAAIASSKTNVAIDIENVRESIRLVAKRFLSQEEKEWTNCNDLLLLTIIWSAKESIYKYYSKGGLIFNNNINIKPFEPQKKGTIIGILKNESFAKVFNIGYEVFKENHILTFINE